MKNTFDFLSIYKQYKKHENIMFISSQWKNVETFLADYPGGKHLFKVLYENLLIGTYCSKSTMEPPEECVKSVQS